MAGRVRRGSRALFQGWPGTPSAEFDPDSHDLTITNKARNKIARVIHGCRPPVSEPTRGVYPRHRPVVSADIDTGKVHDVLRDLAGLTPGR